MIICSNCGSPLSAGLKFCPECGAEVPDRIEHQPPPTLRLNMGANAAAETPASARVSPVDYSNRHPGTSEVDGYVANLGGPALRPQASAPKIFILAMGATIIVALAVIAYLLARSASSSAPSSPESMAAALRSAVDNGRLVTLSGDDAYTYYFRLKDQEPQHTALREIKPRVLPQLRSLGDEVFAKRKNVGLEVLTDRDWTIALRAYEWAHLLEPDDKAIEARWKYAEGHVGNGRNDAQNSFEAASQLDPSWALPVNDLGYTYTLLKRYDAAMPYYQRAIRLQPDWDIPYNNMGTAYYYQKNYDMAQTWYQQTVGVNANWATPHAWLGSIYEIKRLNDAAIGEYRTVLNLYNPNRDRIDISEVQNKIIALQGR